MKYKLIQISAGDERLVCESDNKNVIKRLYDPENKHRIVIDGRVLLMYQAEAWLRGDPIKEYREKKPVVKKPKIKDKRGPGGRPKRVCKVTENGEVLATYASMDEAAEKNYTSHSVIVRACSTGEPTFAGQYFRKMREEE